MSRVSLYKHELEVVAQLTENLTRIGACYDAKPQDVGPEIFKKLTEILYAQGAVHYDSVNGGYRITVAGPRDPAAYGFDPPFEPVIVSPSPEEAECRPPHRMGT